MQHDFWDTSALAKLYLNERGSDWTAERAANVRVAHSRLAIAELASVFARRCVEREISADVRDGLYRQFLADARLFEPISLTDHLISSAANLLLTGTFGPRVRAADAIHLASALWWFEQMRALNIEPGAFIVADKPLRDAALMVGLAVDNPEEHE